MPVFRDQLYDRREDYIEVRVREMLGRVQREYWSAAGSGKDRTVVRLYYWGDDGLLDKRELNREESIRVYEVLRDEYGFGEDVKLRRELFWGSWYVKLRWGVSSRAREKFKTL